MAEESMGGQGDALTPPQASRIHSITERTPTQHLGRVLRIPQRWIDRTEALRRPARSEGAARRTWVLELVCLYLVITSVVLGPIHLVLGEVARGRMWILASVYVGFTYLMTLRGHAQAILTLGMIWVPAWVVMEGLRGTLEFSSVSLLLALMLVMCASSERWLVTALYGVSLSMVAGFTGFATGLERVETITSAMILVFVTSVASVGSATWGITHRRTIRALRENEALAGELKELSIRDELTGLHNRRHFMAELEAATAGYANASLLMIDADHFKIVNDTCGHTTGDLVLKTLAATMCRITRAEDILARIGGEEFAILVDGSDEQDCATFAERLRQEVEAITWPSELKLPGGRLTVSIGCVTAAGLGQQPQALLQRADAALYRSKHDGRNRVTIAGDLNPSAAEPAA